jgi:hypothetical protein
MTITTNKASPTPAPKSQRPLGTGVANTAIAAMPFGAVGLMHSAVAFGPIATMVGVGTIGLVGARAVMRVKPLSAAATARRAAGRRGLLSSAGGSRRMAGGLGGRLGSRTGRSRAGASRHGTGRGSHSRGKQLAGVGAGTKTASRSGASRTPAGTGRAATASSRNPLAGRPGASGTGAKAHASRRPAGSGGSSGSKSGRLRSLLGKVAGGRGKRVTPGSGSSSSRKIKAKTRGKSKGSASRGVLRSAVTKLFSRSSPAVRATRKNARRNARKKRRQLYRRLWRSFKRRMTGRPLRPGDRWWQRWRLGRGLHRAGLGLGLLYRSSRNLALFLAALGTISLSAWIDALRRFGNRAGAYSAAAMRSLAAPLEGLTLDVARFLHEISGVVHPADPITVPPALVEPARTTPRSFDMSDVNITTNLRPLIDAVREASRLGGGDAPHALTVYQWHKDLEELAGAMADLVQADSELAAETLPVSGSAHEITTSFGPAFNTLAAVIQEGTEGWVSANGTRIERLLDDEKNKSLWDHSTRPDA